MVGISFRTPEEGVNYLKSVRELGDIFKSLADPSLGNKISALAQQISETEALSEAKKQQLFDAEETIAQAGELAEELAKAKKEHKEFSAKELSEIQTMRNKLNADLAAFAEEKKNSQANLEKIRINAETALSAAKTIKTAAETKELENSKKDKALTAALKIHQENVLEIDKKHSLEWTSIELAKESNEAAFKAHEAAVQAHELRKKKFEAALKE